jgi:hypothetical protein
VYVTKLYKSGNIQWKRNYKRNNDIGLIEELDSREYILGLLNYSENFEEPGYPEIFYNAIVKLDDKGNEE